MAHYRRVMNMSYFNYHATAKKLIAEGKLIGYRFVESYRSISPALLLYFDDEKHPVMPVRQERWEEYDDLIESSRKKTNFFGTPH